MNKKIALLFSTIALSFVAVGAGAISLSTNKLAPQDATGYKLNVTDMSKIKSDTVQTTLGNKISFYTNDFSEDGVLTDGGYLYNTTAISGIEQVTVSSEQTVKVLGGWYQTGTSSIGFDIDHPFATGTGTVVADFSTAKPDYFAVVADGENATLTGLTVDYGCAVATHHVTLHLYTTNVVNDNDVKVILDSNWTVNNEWINNSAPWLDMTYAGKSGDYEVFDYEADLPYGLVRFQFAATAGENDNRTISRYNDWKPYGFYLGEDTELFCYADNGFPGNNSSTTTFDVYDHQLTNPYYTTINITFAEGSADLSYVGLKAKTGADNHQYIGSFAKNGSAWTYRYKSGENQTYNFFVEAWTDGFSGNAEFVKATSPWTDFAVTITDNSKDAVINLSVESVVTAKANYVATVASFTNCTVA